MATRNETASTPKLSSAEKAAATNQAAKLIIEAEKSRRDAKTEKLRNARLAKAAADPDEAKPKLKTRSGPSRRRPS